MLRSRCAVSRRLIVAATGQFWSPRFESVCVARTHARATAVFTDGMCFDVLLAKHPVAQTMRFLRPLSLGFHFVLFMITDLVSVDTPLTYPHTPARACRPPLVDLSSSAVLQGLGGTRKAGSSVIFKTLQGLVEVETLTKKKVCVFSCVCAGRGRDVCYVSRLSSTSGAFTCRAGVNLVLFSAEWQHFSVLRVSPGSGRRSSKLALKATWRPLEGEPNAVCWCSSRNMYLSPRTYHRGGACRMELFLCLEPRVFTLGFPLC